MRVFTTPNCMVMIRAGLASRDRWKEGGGWGGGHVDGW